MARRMFALGFTNYWDTSFVGGLGEIVDSREPLVGRAR